ncbi:MAG: histidine--tRNA ligase [Hydrogeniiclostridium sp.]
MALLTQAPRGTQDILPAEAVKWQKLEEIMRQEAHLQGFGEIRTPVFEHTELFLRSVGETTDVVQKEMYTFKDKGDRSITLRPEGTAGAVRAMLEHGLYNDGLPLKLYYFTSCYRYEKAQKGRLREFHQFGVEMFGSASPLADAQVIALAASAFQRLGIRDLSLEINSIGCPTCRSRYTAALKEYFSAYKDQLCDTCLSRLDRNPMRILDCKSPVCVGIAEGAPHVLDYLCEDCAAHFEGVKRSLEEIGIPFTVNPTIVRGLDYYTRTVFEFVSRATGSPLTVCGGGRYDGLVEEMGGPSMPALGFGLGLERALMVLDAQKVKLEDANPCKVFIAALGEKASFAAFRMAHELRLSGIPAACDVNGRGLKAQMKYADKIHAAYSMVLGDNELESGEAVLKNMETGEKHTVFIGDGFLEQFAAIEAEDDLKRDFPQLTQEE